MLGDRSENMNGKTVGRREIDGLEFYTGFHQIGDEGNISGEPVQLCDNQDGPVQTTSCEGFDELWTIRPFSAFNLGVFGNELSFNA